MDREFEKGMRILGNLVSFCDALGSERFHMDMSRKNRCLYIEIRAEIDNVEPQSVLDLQASLNVPRQHEMEEYYWELIGEFDSNAELSLVGMMVDQAEIYVKDGQLCICVVRNET